MATDKLNVSQFAATSGLDEDFIRSHPAILSLVRKAISQDWLASPQGKANFQKAFEQTPWFKKNAYGAREYLMGAAQNSADFQQKQGTIREIISQRAQALGATLDEKSLDFFTKAYQMNDWGSEGRQTLLDKALAGDLPDFTTDHIDYSKGGPQAIIATLRKAAFKNGIKFSDDYYTGAAKMILSGTMAIDDYVAEIREHSASRFPIFAERIRAGEDAWDIASPYITRMADKLDLDPNSIDLNDPWITKALGGVDENGKPKAASLWDFEKSLKQHEDWQYSKDASQEIGNVTSKIVSMFSGVSQ